MSVLKKVGLVDAADCEDMCLPKLSVSLRIEAWED